MFRSVPAYPAIARAARATGTVNVDVTVAEDGYVVTAKGVDGHPLLRLAAEVSARGWKFVPAAAAGSRVVRLVFTFHISSKHDEPDLAATFVTPYHVEITRGPNVIIDPPFTLRRRKPRHSTRRRTNKAAQSNNSLDRSGGSVFRIKTGGAKDS